MTVQAFVLNNEFIAEVWKKVQVLKEFLTADKEFISYVKDSDTFSVEHLAKIVETAYWVSHTTEEQNASNVSLVLSEPEKTWDIFSFDKSVPVSNSHIVKLGAALDSGFSDICLWPDEHDRLRIWGIKMRSLNHLTTNLRVLILRPGSIVIMCYGRSIAAITGDKGIFLNPEFLFQTFLPNLSQSKEYSEQNRQRFYDFSTLLQIAQAMRSHRRGGTLLVVPEGEKWQKSVKQPLTYSGKASFHEENQDRVPLLMRPFVRKNPGRLMKLFSDPENKNLAEHRVRLVDQANRIGRLTAADGALVMSADRTVLCFGAKIEAIDPLTGSTELSVLRPIEGDVEKKELLADLGGTRHQSAVQFVHDQPDATAIVASQDGNVTFISRDSATAALLVVKDADLVLMHEGVLGAFWNMHRLLAE